MTSAVSHTLTSASEGKYGSAGGILGASECPTWGVGSLIFDLTINFKSDLEIDLPTQGEFNSIPSLELVHDQDNADSY